MLHTLDMEKNYQKYLKAAIFVGVLFKLLLMGFFSSDYQDQMFIPFVDLFLNGENPYQVYYDNGLLPSFPYPSVMLLVECIGGVFVTFLDGIPVFFQNLVFKLPILLADLLGLYYLFRISRDKRKYIIETKNPVFSMLSSVKCRNSQEINDFSTLSDTLFYPLSQNQKYLQSGFHPNPEGYRKSTVRLDNC